MSHPRTRTLAAAAAALALLAAATPARAGIATVYQCVGPSGQVAAIDMVSSPPTSAAFRFHSLCGAQFPKLAVVADLPNPSWLGPADQRELLVAGPAGTRIVGGRVERQMYGYRHSLAPGDALGRRGLSAHDGGARTVLERCGHRRQSRAAAGADRLAASSSSPARRSNCRRAVDADAALPVGCLSGEARRATPHDVRGASASSSPGAPGRRSGARRRSAWATGSPAGDEPVTRRDCAQRLRQRPRALPRAHLRRRRAGRHAAVRGRARPHCRDVNPRDPDPYEFASAHACPTAPTSRSFALAHLPRDGQHRCASRSRTRPATAPRRSIARRTSRCPSTGCAARAGGCVRAPPAPNGVNATRARAPARSPGRATRRVRLRPPRHDQRAADQPGGQPIGGALIDVGGQTLRDRRGGRWRRGRSAPTPDGRFRYAVPPGSPSRVVGSPVPHARSATPAGRARAEVRIRVRAGVQLRAAPGSRAPGRRGPRPRTAARRAVPARQRSSSSRRSTAASGGRSRRCAVRRAAASPTATASATPPAAHASSGASTCARRPACPTPPAPSRPRWVLVRR